MKPAAWTFYDPASEIAQTVAWSRLGALPRSQVGFAPDPDDRFFAAMYGKSIINVDSFRQMADAMPGTSGDQFEEHLLGSVRAAVRPSVLRTWLRYPLIAVKAPLAIRDARRRLPALARAIGAWRADAVATMSRQPSLTDARDMLRDARRRFMSSIPVHLLVTMAMQGSYAKIAKLAAASGHPGEESKLIRSEQGTDEFKIVSDLWALSQAEIELETFLDRHGYHGPNEGHLDGRVWREDPAPVLKLAQDYARLEPDKTPLVVAASRQNDQRQAIAAVLGGTPAYKRPATRRAIAEAGSLVELRELGKSVFLQCIDGGRAASRAIGQALSNGGLIDEPEDAFYLTVPEMLEDDNVDDTALRGVIAARKEEHEYFLSVSLPNYWVGMPDVGARAVSTDPSTTGSPIVSGIGVSAGVVEGRIRKVSRPDDELEPGEVLVCHTTDPSWSSVMLLASALVIDIGGAMSHAAIVAREFGVPCVINTLTGTSQLQDGQRVRVDGAAGSVTVID